MIKALSKLGYTISRSAPQDQEDLTTELCKECSGIHEECLCDNVIIDICENCQNALEMCECKA